MRTNMMDLPYESGDFSKGYNYIHDEQQWVSLFTFSNDWDWEQVAFEIKAETSRQASLKVS